MKKQAYRIIYLQFLAMFKIYNNTIDMSPVLKIRRKKRPVLMELSK